jgi:hypothetical protein
VHAARVPQALDAARLRSTIASALEDTGLTGYMLDAARLRFRWRGGPADVALDVVAPPANVDEALRAGIERGLERRYVSDGAYTPISFEAIPDGAGFWLLLGYDHLVAGGDSAVTLLGGICARYAAAGPLPSLERHPARFPPMIARHPLQAARAVADCRASRCGRVARDGPGPRDPRRDQRVRDAQPRRGRRRRHRAHRRAARGDAQRRADGRAHSRDRGLKPPPRPARAATRSASRRSSTSAPIARRRRRARSASSCRRSARRIPIPRPRRSTTSCAPCTPRAATCARGAATCARCARSRSRGSPWRVVRDERRDSLYAKHYPVWAGLTTLVVPGLWNALVPDEPARPDAYRRGVSTGPLAPIVVAATFGGSTLEVGVSFRPGRRPRRGRDRRRRPLRRQPRRARMNARGIRTSPHSPSRPPWRLRRRAGQARRRRAASGRLHGAQDALDRSRARGPHPGAGSRARQRARRRRGAVEGPAPRIMLVHGGVYPVHLAMTSFGTFLSSMGYPGAKIRDPGAATGRTARTRSPRASRASPRGATSRTACAR